VIGGHPLFNSKGVPVHSFIATDHFLPENIVDVWDFGYKDEIGTIDPDAVVDATLEHSDSEKLLIWFLQPHVPYIGKTKITKFYPHAKGNLNKDLRWWIEKKLENGEITIDELRQAYHDNLIAVFESIKKLRQINDEVLITSDHGELLGEDGKFFHPSHETENPILRTVPLFIGQII